MVDPPIVNPSHALDIDVVVKKIVNYVSLSNLPTCRLVNKALYHASIPKMQNLPACLLTETPDNKNKIQRFLHCMENSLAFANTLTWPFSNLTLDIQTLDISGANNRDHKIQIVETFWQHASPWLKGLYAKVQLDNMQFSTVVGVRLPNLTKLKVEIKRDPEFKTMESEKARILGKLLMCADNLESIEYFGEESKWLFEILEFCSIAKLSTLKINCANFSGTELIRARIGSLQLTTFSVQITGSIATTSLKRLLARQKNNLETLYFNFTQEKFENLFKRLRFVNVKSLELHGKACYGSVDFAKQFPILKRFAFEDGNDLNGDIRYTYEPNLSLQELVIPYLNSLSFQQEVLKNLQRLLPNVKILTICGKISALPEFSSSLRNITELTLAATKDVIDLDYLLTGYSSQVLAELRQSGEQGIRKFSQEKWRGLEVKAKQFAEKITVLKVAGPCPVEISDVACILALGYMKALHTLDLSGALELRSTISPRVLKNLRKTIKVTFPDAR